MQQVNWQLITRHTRNAVLALIHPGRTSIMEPARKM